MHISLFILDYNEQYFMIHTVGRLPNIILVFCTNILKLICIESFSVPFRCWTMYHICRIFCGMKFSLNRKQTRFLRLYFRGSQVHRGKVARVMYCYKSLIAQTSKFSWIKFLLYQ